MELADKCRKQEEDFVEDEGANGCMIGQPGTLWRSNGR